MHLVKKEAINATPAAVATVPATKSARLTRKDFPSWAEFCEFKAAGFDALAAKKTAKAVEWRGKAAGESQDLAKRKEAKLAKMRAALAAAEAEYAQLTAAK